MSERPAWRILMVDDDQEDYLLTRTMLSAQGREVKLDWAPSYGEAKSALDSTFYDAVLVDYDIGDVTGIQFIRELTGQNLPLPLILYTSRRSYEVDLEARQAGAALYLPKGEATPLLLERSIRYAIDRMQTGQELRREKLRLNGIINSIRDGFFELDQEWRFTCINQHAAEIFNFAPDDLVGQNIFEVFPLASGSKYERISRQVMATRQPAHIDATSLIRDKWYAISVYPSSIGLSVFLADITGRKLAEGYSQNTLSQGALSQGALSQEGEDPGQAENQRMMLQTIVDHAPFGVAVMEGPDLHFVMVNETYAALHGQQPAEMLGRKFVEVHPQAVERNNHRYLQNVFETGRSQTLREFPVPLPADKSPVWINSTMVPMCNLNGEVTSVLNITQEVTEQVQARKAVETLARIPAESPGPVLRLSQQGVLLYANLACQPILSAWGCEVGEQAPDEWKQHIESALAENKRLDFDETFGENTYLFNIAPFSAEGYANVYGADITVRKQVEAQLDQERQLLQTELTLRQRAEDAQLTYARQLEQKNSELRDFAFIAAHDLQEPLRKISAFGEQLKDQYINSMEAGALDYVDRMLNASTRLQHMLRDLLAYSRINTATFPLVQVDLAKTVADVLSDLELQLLETGGKVEVHDLPTLLADATQMRQLFQNLITNALKFHRDNVPPLVHVYARAENAGSQKSVEILVEDNGIGFEMGHLELIFMPFQRLHGRSKYKGNGIGLAICRKIVERHGGAITAQSMLGKGATFIVTLPRQQ